MNPNTPEQMDELQKLRAIILDGLQRGDEASRATEGLADDKYIAHQEATVKYIEAGLTDMLRESRADEAELHRRDFSALCDKCIENYQWQEKRRHELQAAQKGTQESE